MGISGFLADSKGGQILMVGLILMALSFYAGTLFSNNAPLLDVHSSNFSIGNFLSFFRFIVDFCWVI